MPSTVTSTNVSNKINKQIAHLTAQISSTELALAIQTAQHISAVETHRKAQEQLEYAQVQLANAESEVQITQNEIGSSTTALQDLKQKLAAQQQKAAAAAKATNTFMNPKREKQHRAEVVRKALFEVCGDELLTDDGRERLEELIRGDWRVAEEYVKGLKKDGAERRAWLEGVLGEDEGLLVLTDDLGE